MTAPTFGAPLVVNDDWTPYTNGDDFYADISSYDLGCQMRRVGTKILAVYANTKPDAGSRFGESAVVQARFLTVNPTTYALTRSSACDVLDFSTRETGTHKWEQFANSWTQIVPVLGGDYAVVSLWSTYRRTDIGPSTHRGEADLVLLDCTGSAPTVVDTVTLVASDFNVEMSSPTIGRAWDDVLLLCADLEHYPTGGDTRKVLWRAYAVSSSGFGVTADLIEAIDNWANGISQSDDGTVLAAVEGPAGYDGYRILTVDHSTLAITSAVIAPNGTSFTNATDICGVISPDGATLLTGGAADTFVLTTDGSTVTIADTAAHPVGTRTAWYHYDNGPSCGRAYDALGKLWLLYTTEGADGLGGYDTSMMLLADALGAPEENVLSAATLTGGILTDADMSWGRMASLAFDTAGNGVLLINGSGISGDDEAASPYGKYVAVGFSGPAPTPPTEGTPRFALQRTIKQRRYPPITSTPAGNAHLDALAVSGAPQLVRTINGDTEATWQWTAPPDLDHAGLTPGLPLRIPTGPASAWHGQLDQPERDSNTLRGVGTWALAHDKLATADSGHPNAAAHTNECVDNAITDGLNWTRNQDLPNTSGFIQSGTMPLDEFLTTVADDLGEYPHVSDWGEIRIDPPPTDISYLLLATDAPPPTRNDYVTTFVITYVDDVTLDVEIITVTNTAAAAKFGNIQRPLDLTGRGSMSAAHATSIGNGRLSKVRPRARWTDPFTVAPGQLLSPGGVAVDLGSARGFRLARLMLTDVARSSLVDMGVPSVVLIDKVEFDGSALAVYPVDTEGTRLRNLLAKI